MRNAPSVLRGFFARLPRHVASSVVPFSAMRGTGGAWAALGTALHLYLADSTDAGCRKVDLPPLSAGMSMPLQLQAHDKVRLGGCAPRAVDAARVAARPAPRFRLRTASSPKEFVCMDSEGDPDYEAHHLMTSHHTLPPSSWQVREAQVKPPLDSVTTTP